MFRGIFLEALYHLFSVCRAVAKKWNSSTRMDKKYFADKFRHSRRDKLPRDYNLLSAISREKWGPPQSLLFSRLNHHNSLSCCSQNTFSIPFTSFIAFINLICLFLILGDGGRTLHIQARLLTEYRRRVHYQNICWREFWTSQVTWYLITTAI